MANSEKITELIDESAFRQLDKLKKDLSGLQSQFVDTARSAITLNNSISGAKTIQEFNVETEKAGKAMDKMAKEAEKTRLAEIKLAQAREKAFDDYEKKLAKQIALQEKQIEKDKARAAALEKKTKTIISDSKAEVDAYNKSINGSSKVTSTLNDQNKAYAKVTNSATAFGRVSQDSNQKVSKSISTIPSSVAAAQKSIESLKIQLQSYKAIAEKATDPKILTLYNSKIQETEKQIDRLGNVGKDGFDKFGNAVKGNSNLLGKAFSGLRQIAHILPGVGVAGIIAFATEPIIKYISNLEIFNRKLSEAEKTRAALNAISLKGAQDAQTELVSLRQLYLASQNTNNSLSDRKKAVDALQKQYPGYFGNLSDEAILAGKGSAAYDKLSNSIIASATARAGVEAIVENRKQILDKEQRLTDLRIKNDDLETRKFINNTIAKSLASSTGGASIVKNAFGLNLANVEINKNLKEQLGLFNEITQLNIRNLSIQKQVQDLGVDAVIPDPFKEKPQKETDTSLRDALELIRERLEAEKNAAKEILSNDESSFDQRFEALRTYLSKSKELIDTERRLELSAESLTASKKAAINLDAQNKYKAIEIEGGKERQKINKAINDELREVLDEEQRLRIEATENKISELEKSQSEELFVLSERYRNGEITQEEYNRKTLELQRKLAIDVINEQIKLSEALLENTNLTEEEKTKIVKDLSNLRKRLFKETNDFEIKDAEDAKAKKEEILERTKQLYERFYQEIGQLAENFAFGSFQKEKDLLQEQENAAEEKKEKDIEAIEEKKERDIEAVNSEILTAQERADKIKEIETIAAAQKEATEKRQQELKEKIEQKQRALEIQRAKFEKAASIARIAISTAEGVAKVKTQAAILFADPLTAVLAPIALAQIPLIIAVGAAQAAAVLATPIPKFEKGTPSSPEGLAIVGEKGHELQINPDGSQQLTPATPTLTYLKKDTEIISNYELKRMVSRETIGDVNNYVSNSTINLDKLIQTQKDSTQELKQAILSTKTARSAGISFNTSRESYRGYINRNM